MSNYLFSYQAIKPILEALGLGALEGIQRLEITCAEGEYPAVYLRFAPDASVFQPEVVALLKDHAHIVFETGRIMSYADLHTLITQEVQALMKDWLEHFEAGA